MKVDVTNEWQKLPYTSGTIYNNSSCCIIEVSSDQTDGLPLHPGERYTFDDIVLYVRSSNDNTVSARVVPFVEATRVSNVEQISSESAWNTDSDGNVSLK